MFLKHAAIAIATFLFFFTGTAVAAEVASNPETSDVVKQIFDAVVHGQWWAAAAAVVLLGCALLRKYEPDSWKTGTRGEIIGVATVFVMAVAGAVFTTMFAPGAAMSLGVITTAGKIGVAAIGGFEILHRVAGWLAGWSKLPAWAKSILSIVTMLIGSDAVTQAEAAGTAAVAANPAPGMTGGGKIDEVE